MKLRHRSLLSRIAYSPHLASQVYASLRRGRVSRRDALTIAARSVWHLLAAPYPVRR